MADSDEIPAWRKKAAELGLCTTMQPSTTEAKRRAQAGRRASASSELSPKRRRESPDEVTEVVRAFLKTLTPIPTSPMAPVSGVEEEMLVRRVRLRPNIT